MITGVNRTFRDCAEIPEVKLTKELGKCFASCSDIFRWHFYYTRHPNIAFGHKYTLSNSRNFGDPPQRRPRPPGDSQPIVRET
jgi:uncharacterized C2H2 Zn-finger protein